MDSRNDARAGLQAARWQLRLLGGFALDDGIGPRVERLPSRAITLLLVRLALEPIRSHGREELIELLWPEVAPDVGRNRLRQALSALRSVLEPRGAPPSPVLLADRRTVSLVPGALHSDVDALRAAIASGDHAAAARLYRGELLPGFFDDWVIEVRRTLADAYEGLPRPAAAVPFAATGPAPYPAPALALPRLPTYLSQMFGFEAAAATLHDALIAHRLVLLRGPGGAGKTRLAVEVARTLAAGAATGATPGEGAQFDLVAFAALASCTTADAMLDAVLLALRYEGGGAASGAPTHAAQRLAGLERALGGRSALLVLDNFEQLVDAARGELASWLSALPGLSLLVTSRRALGLDGEVELTLAPLALPAAEADLREHARCPAVQLFVARARAARSDFHLNERNHALVAAIVGTLGGLPLAIELAAARVRSISLADMLAMLRGAAREAPGRALGLLGRTGPRGSDDARHASMLKVVEWSWLNTSEAARSLLCVLAVFDGGATLQAAAAVAQIGLADAAVLLDELVSSSVAYVSEGASGSARYHPFEPVREYALMRLGAAEIAHLEQAHLRWVGTWAASLGTAPALAAFRDELPNLLAALAEAQHRDDAAAAIRIVVDAAYALDDVSLPPSALPLLRRFLEGDSELDAVLAARGHAIVAEQAFESGERDAGERHAERAVALAAGAGDLRAVVLRRAARVLLRTRGAGAGVEPLIGEALQLARNDGRHDLEARTLSLAAVLAVQRDRDAQRSLALKRRALALWRAHGPPARVTEGLVNVALGLAGSSTVQEKLELLRQARRSAVAHGQTRLLSFVLSVTGYVLADARQWNASAACFAECLQTAWQGGCWREWFYGMWNLPRTLARQRRPHAAALLIGFAQAFYAQRFGTLEWNDRREARRTRRLVRAQLGRQREAALWREGREMSMAAAMRLAQRETQAAGAPAAL